MTVQATRRCAAAVGRLQRDDLARDFRRARPVVQRVQLLGGIGQHHRTARVLGKRRREAQGAVYRRDPDLLHVCCRKLSLLLGIGEQRGIAGAGTLGVSCAESDELYNYGFANFAGFPNTHNAGLVILDQPIALPVYGVLPTAGVLNDLETKRGLKDTIFTVSGYGLTYRTNDKDALPNISYRSRLMRFSTLINLHSSYTNGYKPANSG